MGDVERQLRRAAGPDRHNVGLDAIHARASTLQRRRRLGKIVGRGGVTIVVVSVALGAAALVSGSDDVVATTAQVPVLDPREVAVAQNGSVELELFDAVRSSDLDAAERLIDSGAVNMEARTINGLLTPLMVAAFRGDTEMVIHLIDEGADLWARSQSGATALGIAARAGAIETWLEMATIEPVPQEVLDRSLTAATLSADPEMVSTVIDAGARLEPAGTDALLLAIHEVFSLEVVEVLIASGVDARVASASGQVPYDVAEEIGNDELMRLLEN